MGRLFGTDGVRGLANVDVTAELALSLSVAAAQVLASADRGDGRRRFAVLGTDSRVSGHFLSAAVIAGIASAGVDVVVLGDLPTPGVAYLTGRLQADFGVMLSASHNAMPDNGIKFLARGGVKLGDALEDEIEDCHGKPWERLTGSDVGTVSTYEQAAHDYVAHLVSTIETDLSGLRVVLDCANGAASAVGPKALTAAGAEVIAIYAEPTGYNINDGCGSTHVEALQKAVIEHRADAGFALDGDADRCLAVDAAGEVVDGDQILAILALALKERDRLAGHTVAATVMSNLGLVQSLQAHDIQVAQTAVGDRYVLETMNREGYSLGGEQSGHVIMGEHATTGDGLLTALHVAARMAETHQSLADLAGVMRRLPQVLINVHGVDKSRTVTDKPLAAAIAAAQRELEGAGRVLLRPSGTEPLVRVMVEAPTSDQAEAVARSLADIVSERLAL